MGKLKIAYLCWLSNQRVRSHLCLRNNSFRNLILRFLHKPECSYSDYAIWNTDFIEEFRSFSDYEFHVVSPHNGMIKNLSEFVEDGIQYHIYKCDTNLLFEAYRSYTRQNERNDYMRIRKTVKQIIHTINPDVVIVCGAEQPNFSPGFWDLKDIPVLVLLETAVNDPLLKNVLKGSGIYCSVEKRSFEEMSYFATGSKKYYGIVREYNKKARCLKVGFPSHIPPIVKNPSKKFDFMFYSAVLSKNKGVEDVILAFNKLIDAKANVTLNICGRCDQGYFDLLQSLINKEAKPRVSFTSFFEDIDEKLKFVQSARFIVLPGITAPLNSTVREAMLMGLPTIVYETEATPKINLKKRCLLCAEMENIHDLYEKMLWALNNPDEMANMAKNAKEYAQATYSNKAKATQLLNASIAIMKNHTMDLDIPQNLMFEP